MAKSFYSVQDVQEMFGVCRTTATKIIHSEGFPMLKIDRKIFIPIAVFEKWFKERTINPKIERVKDAIKEKSFDPKIERVKKTLKEGFTDGF